MARPLPAAGTVDGTGRRAISTRAEGISGGSTMATTPPSRYSIRCSEALVSGSSVCGYRCSDERLTTSGGASQSAPDSTRPPEVVRR
jgi:hypothetical protein